MSISTNLWQAQIGTFGIIIPKLSKAKFQNSFKLVSWFGIMIAKLSKAKFQNSFILVSWFGITIAKLSKAKFQNSFILSFCFLITFLLLLLILSNDAELNLGPKKDSSKRNSSTAHWNLNSIRPTYS